MDHRPWIPNRSQAGMPASVYLVGMVLGLETWHLGMAANMAVVIAGVAVANYGEVHECLHVCQPMRRPPCCAVSTLGAMATHPVVLRMWLWPLASWQLLRVH